MSSSLSSGKKLGRYEIHSKIGEGGMGEVYRAYDPKLNREVAIKVLSATFSADKDQLARFEQEARATVALNHPNIVSIYDVDTHDGSPYVVAEFLEGETLQDRMRDTPLSSRKALDYALQIAEGLAKAHERGIVHRDLKPANIFITTDERVKILDFGLAKLTELSSDKTQADELTLRVVTSPGTVMGTVGYMSPEQVRGQSVDHRRAGSNLLSWPRLKTQALMLAHRQARVGVSQRLVRLGLYSKDKTIVGPAPRDDYS